ncbi:MAG: tetratricopeptide repeat protein [Myxococcota bacterium]
MQDVIVVGASVAGLYAAYRLAQAGVRVRVFEAQPELNPEARTLIVTPAWLRMLDFDADEATVVASDVAAELAQSTREEGQGTAAVPETPPLPPALAFPEAEEEVALEEEVEIDDDAWAIHAADAPTAFGEVPEPVGREAEGAPPGSNEAGPPEPAAPPEPAPPLPTTPEEPPSAPVPTPARREAEPPGARAAPPRHRRRSALSWLVLVLLVGGLGAGGGYFGYQRWIAYRAEQATAHVNEASGLAALGDHAPLEEAERELQRARELHPKGTQAMRGLLFVRMHRALEDGTFDPDGLRSSIDEAARGGVGDVWLRTARTTVAAMEGASDAEQRVQGLIEQPIDEPERRYVAGRLLQWLGHTEDAVATLSSAVEASASLHVARLALAELQLHQDDPAAAARTLGVVQDAAPDHLRARLWQALLEATGDDPQAVVTELEGLAEAADDAAPSDRVLLHLARARARTALEQPDEATAALREAARVDVAAPRLLALIASDARRVGELELARQSAARAVSGAPAHLGHRKLLADVLIRQRDGEAAFRALEPLDAQAPDVIRLRAQAALVGGDREALASVHRTLAERLRTVESPEVALRALQLRVQRALGEESLLEQARELQQEAPEDPTVAMTLGEVAFAAGRADLAIDALQPLVKAEPGWAEAHYLLGRAHRLAGDADAAQTHLERAVELDAGHVDARLALGYLLLDRGANEPAEALYRDLLEEAEGATEPPARLGLVEALTAQGKTDAARDLLDQAAEGQQDSSPFRMAAARLALAERKGGKAVRHLEPLVEAPEDASADLLALYGDALYEAGRVDAAKEQYELALDEDPDHPEALHGRARVLVRAERPKAASEALERAEPALQTRIRPPSLRARLLALHGRALLQRGALKGARDSLREATSLRGGPASAWFFLGEALAGANAPEARAAYEEYLEREPTGPYAIRAKRAIR